MKPDELEDSGSIYAIGDLQGCYESLEGLMDQLPAQARLVFVGDIVNRGPQSLKTLRFVKSLGNRARMTLGNHDLHLLAVAAGAGEAHRKDTIQEVLEAPDAAELIDWLRAQPLLIEEAGVVFVHAGIHPLWSLELARSLAAEAHEALSGPHWKSWLQGMYGNTQWRSDLVGPERMRAILNGFTRMRFVRSQDGSLDFEQKEGIRSAPAGLIPWFEYPARAAADAVICFGHWSMLGLINRPNIIAIDTGCLWGGELTAVRFPDRRFFREPCPCWADPLAYSSKKKDRKDGKKSKKSSK